MNDWLRLEKNFDSDVDLEAHRSTIFRHLSRELMTNSVMRLQVKIYYKVHHNVLTNKFEVCYYFNPHAADLLWNTLNSQAMPCQEPKELKRFTLWIGKK